MTREHGLSGGVQVRRQLSRLRAAHGLELKNVAFMGISSRTGGQSDGGLWCTTGGK